MSLYAVYKMHDGCDMPYNIEANGHLIGTYIGTCDTDPTVTIASHRDGWHAEPPSDDRYVLCQGARSGFFIGAFKQVNQDYGMKFYVAPHYNDYRYAVAWHELPSTYKG